MARFSVEQKVEAVRQYIEEEASLREIAHQLGTRHSTIYKWVHSYQAHGREGLRPKKKCTRYSGAFKMDVLTYMNETGASLYETAVNFQITSHSTILRWKQLLEEEGAGALLSKKEECSRMKRNSPQPDKESNEALQAELEYLRMENAYLKKLNALVQKERASQRAKKRSSSKN